MHRSLVRATPHLAIVVFAILFLDGCVISHRATCVPAGDVIPREHIPINLTDLTAPGPGRNITSSTREDRITATLTPLPAGPAGGAEIRFVAGPDVTWWKAVEVRQGTPGTGCFANVPATRLEMIETQDERRTGTRTIPAAELFRSTLVLWKGKAAQVHTPMYQLRGNLAALSGQRLTITWEID